MVTGSNILDEGGDTYKIEKLIGHSGYVPQTITNDIALIKLQEEIKYNDKVQPIKLPEKDTGCSVELVLSGWGTTTVNSNFLKYIFNTICLVLTNLN